MPAYRDFRLDVGDLIEGQLTRCRLFVRMRDIDVREPDANAMEKVTRVNNYYFRCKITFTIYVTT